MSEDQAYVVNMFEVLLLVGGISHLLGVEVHVLYL